MAKSRAANLHFFTGENEYALRREVSRWKEMFFERHGFENYLEVPGRGSTLAGLLDAVSVMPFLAEKRLVLIDGLPQFPRESFPSFLESIHPQVVVAVVEPKPDKRLGIVKDLEAHASVKRFPALSDAELMAWLIAEASKLLTPIERAAAEALLAAVGTDQRMLKSELQKISLFSAGTITVDHVNAVVVPAGSQVIWQLTDLLSSRRTVEALRFLRGRLDRGEDSYALWIILLSMVRNLGLVWAGVQDGQRDSRSIASAFALHPFVVSKILPLARSLSVGDIHRIVAWSADADLAMKTGGYHFSSEHPDELIVLMERVMVMVGGMG